MELTYGTSNFDPSRGNLISLPVVNMYVEQAESEKNPVLLSRPALVANSPLGDITGNGPVLALFQLDGVLNGDYFGIANINPPTSGSLYRNGIFKGTVNGSGVAKIDAFPSRIFCTMGSTLYTYDGTTFASVATPGGFNVRSLCVGANRLIVLQNNSGTFYWSDLLSTNINALSFATAETQSDNTLDCIFLGDTLILFGSKTVEFWPTTTDPNSPYQPLVGRTFPIGIKATGCVTKFKDSFAWVTNYNQVCYQNPDQIISTPDIEEKISSDTSYSLWRFILDGTEFLALRLTNHTYVFSSKSQLWSEFKSYGQSNWLAQCWSNGIFGTSLNNPPNSGTCYMWGLDYYDLAESSHIMERTFRAGVPIDGGTQALNNIMLRMNPGQALAAQDPNPVVNMRTSRDGGQTWGPWQPRAIGTVDSGTQYRTRVQWRSQGYFGHPGILCEFQALGSVPFRVSGVTANESYADVGR